MVKNENGLSLVELMCALSLVGVICTAMMSIESRLYRGEEVASGYVSDLGECRRTVRHLEQDLRAADRITTTANGIRIHTGATTTDYTLGNGVLERADGSRTRAVARRIASFEAVQVGRRVDIRVVLQRRSRRHNAHEAAIHTSVFLRGKSG